MEKSSWTALARQQPTLARNASSGPRSQTVHGGQEHAPDGGELAAVTIVVNGRNVEVPEHYRMHVEEKMAHVQRYNDTIIHYDVELFHENNHRQSKLCQRVEITGTGNGPVVRAEARGPDFYAALAAALAKLKTQLRRSHDRRQVHHGHRTPTSVAEATGTLELRTMSTPPDTANDEGPECQRESYEVGPGTSCGTRSTPPNR